MQVSKTQSIRLANIMGLDFSNQQDQVGILDALSTVSDPNDFIKWMREKRDTVEYSNRREKLTILHTRYRNTVDSIPTQLLEKFSREITNKFKEAISILRDNEPYLSQDLTKLKADGSQYFTSKEVELLDSVGGLNRLINLHELGTLYETLYNKSVVKTIEAKNYAILTDGQKKIKELTNKLDN